MRSGEHTGRPSAHDADTDAEGRYPRQATALLAFGPFRLDPRQRRLFRVTNTGEETVALGSRALELLLLLIRRPGALVSKDELIDAAWPGVAVEENNLSVQMSALRRALGDGQHGARLIETVPGRGYRFLTAVTACSEPAPESAPTPLPELVAPTLRAPPRRFPARLRPAASALVIISAALAGLLFALRSGVPVKPDVRPTLSIVVLPFTTGGADRSYDYIAEAITDDLTTKVAEIDGTFVIARGTASAFRGQTDSRSVAAQLGVRYLLEGSARPLGEVTRVNARLVEADSGATIWSDQFDSGLVGLPAAQDDAVNRIAVALGSRLVDTEARRLAHEHPTDASALDLILRARSILNLPQNAERNERATTLLRQALERDPLSVEAMTRLGDLLVTRWTLVRDGAGGGERIAKARTLLAKAAAINPASFGVVALRASLLRVGHAWQDAEVEYREALVLRPGWSGGYNQLALCALMLGRPEEAVTHIQHSLQLDPKSPSIHTRYALMGEALLTLGRNEEAVEWLRRAVQAFPPPQTYYRDILAAALGRAGLRAQAEEELGRALERSPCMTVSSVRHRSEPSSARSYWNALANGLELAGLRNNAEVDGRVASPSGRCDRSTRQPPGVGRLTTDELHRLVTGDKPPVLLATFRAIVSIPGTVWVSPAAVRPNATTTEINAFRQQLEQLTGGDRDRPIVTVPWNVETAGPQPLSALAVSLGYRQVYSYPDGLETWIARDQTVESREYRRDLVNIGPN